ncbi:Putative nuclease [Frankliniella fusca]|uniref:Nuclease n=1 Tax=Frankliniella fusca TaxID=407009 RepID=A0AAE1LIH7_9NEOP|nr:Putative nuclease [Frankliniella fusca]
MEAPELWALLTLFDTDEDEIRDPVIWEKITVNVDEYLHMSDAAFKLHFRMTTDVFELLLHDIAHQLDDDNRQHTDVDYNFSHMLLMVLWVLATPDSFRSIALRFGKTPGVVHYHYKRIIMALCDMSDTLITWPTHEERQVLSRAVLRRTGFPGVIGALDGCHINIITPRVNPQPYFNRKHDHSIVLQAVADCNLLFRDVYVGQPGSIHDSRVFRRSPLCAQLLNQPGQYLDNDQHILGDGAYILTDKVLTPFRNNGNLNEHQINYNCRHSSARSSVERAFGALKMKWRRLFYLHSWNIEYAVMTIVACVCIHNYLRHQGQLEDEADVPQIIQEPELLPDDGIGLDVDHPDVPLERDHPLLAEARRLGIEKRWDIVGRLPPQQNH